MKNLFANKSLFTTLILMTVIAFTGCSYDGSNPTSSENNLFTASAGSNGIKDSGKTLDGSGPITYDIELISYNYNSTNDVTEFTYSVHSNPNGGPAISHWDFGFKDGCGDAGIIAWSNDPLVEWSDPDPTTDVRGIKFDTGYNDDEIRTVELHLYGEWSVGDVVIAVKAGNGFVLGSAQGPVCGGVNPPEPEVTYNVDGYAYFDINGNGVKDVDEPGLPGVEVNLSNGDVLYTDENGYYLFEDLLPGDYTVEVGTLDGFNNVTPTSIDFTIVDSDLSFDFGFAIDYTSIGGAVADGFTIGYWKNNINKAIQGKTKGVQVSAATLEAYLVEVSGFALYPFTFTTPQEAYDVLSATCSDPVLLLEKQLMGSEFNLMNGAYIGGNELLTEMFLYYGEYLVVYSGNYSSSELLDAKDWFDAYNNSHGEAIVTP